MDVNSAARAAKVLLDAYASRVPVPLPAPEIIDSRIADWTITLADTIADNSSSGALEPGHLLVKLPRSDVIGVTSAKAVAERDRAEG